MTFHLSVLTMGEIRKGIEKIASPSKKQNSRHLSLPRHIGSPAASCRLTRRWRTDGGALSGAASLAA
jgi:hypothetical protein